MELTLRKANADELAFVQEFAKAVIDKNYRSYMGDEAVDFFIGSGASDQYMQECLDDTILAVADGAVVGISVCKDDLIDLFMVRNELQGKGVGGMFMSKLCEELLQTYPRIRVECFEKNEKANCFYERCGWIREKMEYDEEIGDKRVFYYKLS